MPPRLCAFCDIPTGELVEAHQHKMDDLLDLNWSSSSSHNASQKKPAAAPFGATAFDSLARAGSPGGANYYGSSSSSSGIQPIRAVSPSVPLSKSPASSKAKDAFSSLFETANGTRGAAGQNTTSMTMQERLNMQRSGSGASYACLLVSCVRRADNKHDRTLSSNNAGSAQKAAADPWDFDMLASSSSSPKILSVPASNAKARPSSPFDDLADFGVPTNGSSHASHQGKGTLMSFDDNNDVLGLLGQPVSNISRKASPPSIAHRPASPPLHAPQPRRPSTNIASTSSRPPSRAVAARTPSPPPHILGQVVMMGFSVQQARLALGATLGGKQAGQWDIVGALEILASDGAASAERARESKPAKTGRSANSYADGSSDDEQRPISQITRNGRGSTGLREGSEESALRARTAKRQGTTSPPSHQQPDGQQPDLLAQASVFGSSMLKSANAYWKTSRAQLSKAVEESKFIQTHIQQVGLTPGSSVGTSRSTTPSNGRPKWMTDAIPDEPEHTEAKGRSNGTTGSFRHADDGDAVLPPHPTDGRRSATAGPSARRTRQQAEVNLFGDEDASTLPVNPSDRASSSSTAQPAGQSRSNGLKAPEPEPRAYVSPNRRKPAAPAATSAPAPAPARRPVQSARTAVPASAAQLASSSQHRAVGNEHFKLGRYGEASEAYGKALLQLPERHLARIAVLNNRSNARLKNGEEKRAAEDATAALSILLGEAIALDKARKEDYYAAIASLESTHTDEKMDAADALGKALSRRARAHEGCEKWRLAMLDWQMLVELGAPRVSKSAGGPNVISSGLARCRKVVEGGSSAAASASTKPPAAKPRPPPARPTSTKPSAAVQALRQDSQKQEAEEKQRQDLKDSVDAKITTWKGGKETNLRALIASLDTVLWDGTGWTKVGMHELITEGQLKVRYMKAIAKVHPDKVCLGR